MERLCSQIAKDCPAQPLAEACEWLIVAKEPLDAQAIDQRADDSRRLARFQVAAELAFRDPARYHLLLERLAAQDESQSARAHVNFAQAGAQEVEIDKIEVAMPLRSLGKRAQIR